MTLGVADIESSKNEVDCGGLILSRLCIVEKTLPGVLAEVFRQLGQLNVNIRGDTVKSKGKLTFQVVDVELKESQLEHVVETLSSIHGVKSCRVGSFSEFERQGTVRLCIVNDNVPGVLGDVVSLLGNDLQLTALSHTNRSQGKIAYTVFELEHGGQDWEIISSLVEKLDHVKSCTLNSFKGGDFEDVKFLRGGSVSSAGSTSELAALPTVTFPGDHETLWDEIPGVQKKKKPKAVAEEAEAYYEGVDNKNGSNKGGARGSLALLNERIHLTKDSFKLVVAMVGLPARGKSFTARKLKRFLCWRNSNARIFNAGKYRRHRSSASESDSAAFFQGDNEEGAKIRQMAANDALGDLLEFLKGESGSAVGIFDATNSSVKRRKWIVEQCKGVGSVVFVEVVCDDEQLLVENMLSKIRTSPDYRGIDEQKALEDLRDRIRNYEAVYEPLCSSENVSYIRIFNMSSKILCNNIYGRLSRSVLPYMLSLHLCDRPIWFVRAGLAEKSRLGPDFNGVLNDCGLLDPSTVSKGSKLSPAGEAFAHKLARWISTALWANREEAAFTDHGLHTAITEELEAFDAMGTLGRKYEVRKGDGTKLSAAELKVVCSTLPRAEQTARIALEHLEHGNLAESAPMLNPLDKGELAGMSMQEIATHDPEFYEKWTKDPYRLRFPGGESYYDLVTRLEPTLIEIEQQTAPVLVVSHVSCIQVLLAYYLAIPVQDAMKIKVNMHQVIQLIPTPAGTWEMSEYVI